MSKEEAIDAAKQKCTEKGYIGFVLVGKWSMIYFKSVEYVLNCSFKHTHQGLDMETHVWLTEAQQVHWNTAVQEHSEKMALVPLRSEGLAYVRALLTAMTCMKSEALHQALQ